MGFPRTASPQDLMISELLLLSNADLRYGPWDKPSHSIPAESR